MRPVLRGLIWSAVCDSHLEFFCVVMQMGLGALSQVDPATAQQLATAHQQLADLKKQNDAEQIELKAVKAQVAAATKERDSVKEQLSALQQSSATQITTLQGELKTVAATLAVRDQALKDSQEAASKTEARLSASDRHES
jgi:uncharacterized protein (DUF3084 family)